MKHRNLTIAISLAIAVVAGSWGMQQLSAQQPPPGFKRVVLLQHDMATPGREMVVARGEFAPGAMVPKHTHPGDESSYVLQGEVQLMVEGSPPKVAKAGEMFFVPAGTVHSAKNVGTAQALVLSTYVVEKGKPLATPVSK